MSTLQLFWMLLVGFIFISYYVVQQKVGKSRINQRRHLNNGDKTLPVQPVSDVLLQSQDVTQRNQPKDRLLYIVTSIAEFDNGRRATAYGNDRYTRTIVPIIVESVQSMMQTYQVDLFVITHYTLSQQRYRELRQRIPATVGIQIWDDATPYGYVTENTTSLQIQHHTRGLSRQHRYVIKDKIYHYDIFVNFEDDMLLHTEHVQHYVYMTNTLYQLRKESQQVSQQREKEKSSLKSTTTTTKDATLQFYGAMTSQQLGRTIPGFIRVEVVTANFKRNLNQQRNKHNIPMDYVWDTVSEGMSKHSSDGTSSTSTLTTLVIDASICCHVSNYTSQQRGGNPVPVVPTNPSVNDVYFWEMNIESLGVRKMPNLKNIYPNTTRLGHVIGWE
jgi:hypothetical protein